METRSPQALAYGPFRLFWGGALLTYTAQWVQQVALGYAVYEITASTLAIGLVLGARAIPMFLLAPFSGVAADRYDRRMLLAMSQLSLCIATALVAIQLARGKAGTLDLALFMVVAGIAGTFERNARHAMVLDLVPREAVTSAIALNNIAFSGARMGAPGIAGYLIALFGTAANFFLQSAVYLVVACSLYLLKLPRHPRGAASKGALQAMAEGLRYSWENRTMRMLLWTGVLPYLLLYPIWSVLFPAFAKDAYRTGPEGLGLMYAAVGLGGFIGGVLGTLAHRIEHIGRLQLGSLAAIAIGLVGTAMAPTVAIGVPFMALSGAGEVLYTVINQTLVQLAAPAEKRGRVTSLLAIFPGFISLGGIWVGAAGDALGPRGGAWLGAGFAVLIGIAILVWAPRLVRLRVADLRQS